MSLTIAEYRCKLVNLILLARSEEDVRRYVHASVKGLREYKLNGHLILRFVQRTIKDLEGFTPRNAGGQQSKNIQMARTQLQDLKDALQELTRGRIT